MAKKTASGVGVAEETWADEIEKDNQNEPTNDVEDFGFDELIDEPDEKADEEEIKEERNGQGILPGTKYANPEIVVAARDYADKRDARMDWQRQEKKAMEFLTALMDKKGIEELHDGDVHITAERTRKFKVKIGNGDDSDE